MVESVHSAQVQAEMDFWLSGIKPQMLGLAAVGGQGKSEPNHVFVGADVGEVRRCVWQLDLQ